jgi:aldehyde dehydrogenase (NAD+)
MTLETVIAAGANAPEMVARQLLIDGQKRPASSGKSFATINPSTGKTLALIAEGGAEDIDLAVAAARRAFEGQWSTFKPAQRQKLLLRLAALIGENGGELAQLDSMEMGAPIRRTQAGIPFAQTMI